MTPRLSGHISIECFTHVASIYANFRNKTKRLHKKRVQLHLIGLEHQHSALSLFNVGYYFRFRYIKHNATRDILNIINLV